MADNESDPQIDGKSVYSLRVVDLKQELKKKDIVFKANASKAQLQALIIEHLQQTIDGIEDKSSEDNSRTTIQSDDTNEALDSNNVHSFGDNKLNLDEEQTEVTDLSSDKGITSSVSFGDKNSIKLKIKLQPNDSPNRQLSPKKSPIKEMRSPVVVFEDKITEEVFKPVVEVKTIQSDVQDLSHNFAEDLSKKSTQEVYVKEVKQKPIEESPQKSVTEEEVKQDIEEQEVRQQSGEQNDLNSNINLVSIDSKELTEKSDEIISESKKSVSKAQDLPVIESIVEDNVISKTSQEFKEQTNETEKVSIVLTQTSSEVEIKESIEEPVIQRLEEKTEKIVEKENKSLDSEPKADKPKPPRRRRWGGSVATDLQTNQSKGISSAQLKELMPDLAAIVTTAEITSKVSKTDANNTSLVVTSSQSRTQTMDTNHELPAKRDIRVVRKSVSVPEEGQTSTEESVRPQKQAIVEQKQKIIVEFETKSDEQQEVNRELSPALNTESTVVFIRNLVRPFTLLQLKEVLGKTGKLIEERFWIDKIKSKCFATYDTVEEAVATRLALHGTRWPASNPKLLSVDFTTKEELDSHLNEEIIIKRDLSKKSDENVVQKYDIVIKSDDQKRDKENKTENRPIREWDREKLVPKEEDRRAVKRRANSPAPRSRSQERDIKRRRQDSTKAEERLRPADSTSTEVPTAEVTHESESPAKLLDDLFRKTTATPSIYWLPLTEEQVVARDALRAEEDKKRQEERNAREEQFRKRAEDNRRPFDSPFRFDRNQQRSDSPPFRRNFGRPPPRRSPPPGRRSPPRRRTPPPNRFSRSRSRSPINRRKR